MRRPGPAGAPARRRAAPARAAGARRPSRGSGRSPVRSCHVSPGRRRSAPGERTGLAGQHCRLAASPSATGERRLPGARPSTAGGGAASTRPIADRFASARESASRASPAAGAGRSAARPPAQAQPREAEDRRLPEPAERGGVHAAGGVAHVVGQVDLAPSGGSSARPAPGRPGARRPARGWPG